ncbi:MAG: MATE family efflux transporter [Lachnospiraceae bacterium]|nr:MATE family efflux transporter [Lachnospiraceae bacterium]
MKEGKQPLANQITEGVIWKQILLFFFPILLGSLFQQLYNTADAIIVGRCAGKEALSAVGGSTASVINIFVGFFMGISSGATVVAAHFYGGEQENEVAKTVHTSLLISLCAGVLLGALGIVFAPDMLRLLKTPENIFGQSLGYMRIYFAAAPANLFYIMGAGILRAVGDSKRPLYFLIVSCLVNIPLDFLFVEGFQMAAEGAAVATVLSQILSAVMVFVVLYREKHSYRLIPRELFRCSGKIWKRVLWIGIPAGLQSVTYGLSNSVVQAKVNSFGTDNIAAWSAYVKLDGLYWMTVSAMGIAVTTFVGQNIGAGKAERARKSMWECMAMTMVMAGVLTIFFYAFAEFFFGIFVEDAGVISLGVSQLRFLTRFYLIYVIVEILSGALRGMECVVAPTVISILLVCVLRVAWVEIATPIRNTMETVMMSYPVTWTAASAAFIIYYIYYTKKTAKAKGRN